MMNLKKMYASLLMVSGALFLAGCWPFESGKHGAKPELVIINVLEKAEFEDCHIQGSINIPFDEFESKISYLNKQNHYVIYCADYMCMSSGFCANLLKKAKFEYVWAYEGGMAEWYQKGYPFAGVAQFEYLASQYEDMLHDESGDVATISAEKLLEKIKDFAVIA